MVWYVGPAANGTLVELIARWEPKASEIRLVRHRSVYYISVLYPTDLSTSYLEVGPILSYVCVGRREVDNLSREVNELTDPKGGIIPVVRLLRDKDDRTTKIPTYKFYVPRKSKRLKKVRTRLAVRS
ncbi:MAG: hypothetical protein HYW26_00940 [Candidatus Aenigmarchaeota archaeon]|nr:hypothetical protein [Candidatus Aenigmarchaeota archaeon]